MTDLKPKLTKAQREALAACVANYAKTIVTPEEYEAASPFHREKYRNGFDAAGQPILRRQWTMLDRRVGWALAAAGLVSLRDVDRNTCFARPTSRALAAERERAEARTPADERAHRRTLREIAAEIETRDYELTYGHGPRGRGSWAFEFFRGSERILDATGFYAFFTPGSTTWGDAKRWAAEKAVELRATRVVAGT